MKVIILGLVILYGLQFSSAKKKIICYHGTWSVYRPGNGKFGVEDINPFLCTHLIYSFFGITSDGRIRIIDSWLDLEDNWGRGNIKKFNDLKRINPQLKTLAAVGGWNEGSLVFSQVANDPTLRKIFATDATNFLLAHNFDGLDFDWEYPGQRGGDPSRDKESFVLLLKELKEQFSQHNLILTSAVASAEFSASISYDIPLVVEYLDFINVMTYDLHGPWDDIIGINAPLYPGPADMTALQKQLNVNTSINYWLNQGAPPEKLILGIPLYGRTFTLRDASKNVPGSFHNGPGQGGQYTFEPGNMGYNEFCEKQLTERWSRHWEPTQMVPYAYQGLQWIGYDDVESVALKAYLVKQLNLGGAMVWAIETDDFRNICGKGTYPLLTTINHVLRNGSTIPTPPPVINTTSTTISSNSPGNDITTSRFQSTTTSNPSSFKCLEDGIFRDPNNCSVFYVCNEGKQYPFRCPSGLLFDVNIHVCNWPHLVTC